MYEDKLIKMEGIIVEITDGSVAIDLKGRLGYFKMPMRMLITDYPLQVGQEVAFQMSFPEVIREDVDAHYRHNIERRMQKEALDE